MLLIFGVLLLASSVLSKKDNVDSIYRAIKDIIGFNRNEVMKLKEYMDPKKEAHGKFGEKVHNWAKAMITLPSHAQHFILALLRSAWLPGAKMDGIFHSYNEIESFFRGVMSKKSCSKLLKTFPGIAKYS
ncbi:unnamed protein product [Haemonchus placei]|uniref:Secreted protein n=1 Tax=Haemonchus placei TaxID=6290 RepID=A0A158QR89_HAEPC|nr:unnamed protein product [Haemonchus placei]